MKHPFKLEKPKLNEHANHEVANDYPTKKLYWRIFCSHGNCEGDHHKQLQVADTVLDYIKQGLNVKGILLESHIRSGRADIQSSNHPGPLQDRELPTAP